MTRRALNADGGLSEAAWQAQVVGLARLYDWRVYHPPDNRPDRDRAGRAGRQHVAAGFPDLVLLRPPELIFAELKTEKGRLSVAQHDWLRALLEVEDNLEGMRDAIDGEWGAHEPGQLATVEVYVWRPADFDDVNVRLARGRTRLEPAASRP